MLGFFPKKHDSKLLLMRFFVIMDEILFQLTNLFENRKNNTSQDSPSHGCLVKYSLNSGRYFLILDYTDCLTKNVLLITGWCIL